MLSLTRTQSRSDVFAIAFSAFMGIAILFVAGFAGADTLHGATHDTRHATGFPCH
jgi:cobalt transporter subunit CbtB